MMMKSSIFVVALPILFTGCASFAPSDIAKPSEITVQNALGDIGEGLNLMKEKIASGNNNFGLLAEEVVVELKIGANAKDSGKLGIDVGRTGAVNASVKGEISKESSADRSNTIKITFKNLLTVELNESTKARYTKVDMPVPVGGSLTTNSVDVKKTDLQNQQQKPGPIDTMKVGKDK
jgi:hypothetical protein